MLAAPAYNTFIVKCFCCANLQQHTTFLHTHIHLFNWIYQHKIYFVFFLQLDYWTIDFQGVSNQIYGDDMVRIAKSKDSASCLSKVRSVENALVYQSSTRYSIVLYSLSDLTVGKQIFKYKQTCYARRIAMTNSTVTKVTYPCH